MSARAPVSRESSQPTRVSDRYSTPLKLVITIAVIVFAVEVIEPVFFPLLPPMSRRLETLIDGLVMTSVLAPLLYFLIVRRMVDQIARREAAEDELQRVNTELEGLVGERTNDLVGTSRPALAPRRRAAGNGGIARSHQPLCRECVREGAVHDPDLRCGQPPVRVRQRQDHRSPRLRPGRDRRLHARLRRWADLEERTRPLRGRPQGGLRSPRKQQWRTEPAGSSPRRASGSSSRSESRCWTGPRPTRRRTSS